MQTRSTLIRLVGLASLALFGVLPARAQLAVNQTEASTPSEIAETLQTRYFQEVHDATYPGAYQALSRLSYNGDFILLVETDAARRPISDTLLVWIQHHGPDQPLAKQARWADLIISCYPEQLPDAVRSHHALPEAHGKVWLYFVEDRHLIVSDQRQPALDFALTKKF
jgi:hypothetical protein